MTARGIAGRALACALLVAPGPIPASLGAQAFTVTDSSVREGAFQAVALTRGLIVSTYPRAAREVRFRFSINGLENEFPGGTEHTIYLRPTNGRMMTQVYRFADETEPPPPVPTAGTRSEEGTAQVTFRVDLTAVKRAIATTGRYQPPLGAPVTRIERVYVLGDPQPLSWDYAQLRPGTPPELTDVDGDGVYEGTVPIATEYTRPQSTGAPQVTGAEVGGAMWTASANIAAFPRLTSKQRLQEAVYDLALEELTQLRRSDGAFSAGAKWEGVWTRDVSLSVILSLALIAPEATRTSLMAKVDSSGRIIQDTGTGGSWPVSSDRMVWALAAWELYAATGDRDWLATSYAIVARSAEADLHAVRDAATGLFAGESSFEDWREQSYPRWMQPADIYVSQNLGTNAVHYAAYRVLGDMARALGRPAARWDAVAAGIKRGMSAELWQPELGWFAQYRYGRASLARSPRADGLGEALASIYGAASLEQRQALMRSAPVTTYGTPSFWPFIEGERLYHNATVWPFVTAYWTWAAAEGGNTEAVRRGLDAATRATALFLTNKENMVAATGHYEGTALNSDRQLWSVAGTLAGTYRLLFGIRLEPSRMAFRPMVPPSYAGDRTLTGLAYRGAVLDITVRGFGNGVASMTIDGKRAARAAVPATMTGAHRVEITMNGRWPATTVNEVPARFAPATPRSAYDGVRLVWGSVPGAVRYRVFRNGRRLLTTTAADTTMERVAPRDGLDEYQVLAVNAAGDESFLGEPVRVLPAGAEQTVKSVGAPLEREHAGFTGAGYVRLTTAQNVAVRVPFRVARAGTFVVDARYANGNGPVNTEDKAGVRTLLVDGDTAGVLVLPQRGVNRWNEWGWSNARRVDLSAGAHVITIAYTPLDANMNRRENTALLDAVRVTRLSTGAAGLKPRRPAARKATGGGAGR